MKQVKNNSKKRIKVLVNGAGGPAGVNVCKLLQKYKKNVEVFACDINKFSAGSNFSEHFVVCPYVEKSKALKWYTNIIKKNKIDIMIPTVAETLVEMFALQEKVKSKTEIIISDIDVIKLCHEKDKLYNWMDINFPEYMGKWIVTDDLEKVFKSKDYFIKPIVGRGSRGCRKISRAELEFMFKDNKEGMKNIVIMEVLPGREWTVDVYINKDGSISYMVPRLRLGLSGGISSLGRTDKNKKIILQSKKVFSRLNCRGPVFVQWKEDEKGNPKMVEINPRVSGGLTISSLAGGDFSESFMAEIKGKPVCNKEWKEITVVRYLEDIIL